MNVKERLEEIKSQIKGHEKELPNVMWLIEQAERVRELEKDYKFGAEQMKNVVNMHNEKDIELRKTQMQNKRYREALEQIEMVTKYEDEANEIAHRALECESNESRT